MALPGDRTRSIIPPQRFRLAIGETRERNGRMLPTKLDYWSIRTLSVQSGQVPTYVVHPEAQAAMCVAAGVDEKPRAIPVTLIGNPVIDAEGLPQLPESILWSRMARYSGGKCVCQCKTFGADGTGTATERQYQEKKSAGEHPKSYYLLAGEKQIQCNPAACPWATGDHSIAKYKGTPLCKPQVVLSVALPWFPVVGTVAKFKTTGWSSYSALRSSLLAIAAQTNGWLHELPNLWLVLDWERAGNGNMVPAVRMEYRGLPSQLRAMSADVQGRWLQQQEQLLQLGAGVVATVEHEEADEREQQAHQVEFVPEASSIPPVIDAEFSPEPEPEEQGEDLVLQMPPAAPPVDDILTEADLKAALPQVGVTTKEGLIALKERCGLADILLEQLDVDALQRLYAAALGQVGVTADAS
jgi:hypothetical protein